MKNSMIFSGLVSFKTVREDRNGTKRVRLGVYQRTPSYDAFGNPAGSVITLITVSVPPALTETAMGFEKQDPIEVRGVFSSWSPKKKNPDGSDVMVDGKPQYDFPVMQINATYIGSSQDSTEVVEKAVAKAVAQEEEDDMPF